MQNRASRPLMYGMPGFARLISFTVRGIPFLSDFSGTAHAPVPSTLGYLYRRSWGRNPQGRPVQIKNDMPGMCNSQLPLCTPHIISPTIIAVSDEVCNHIFHDASLPDNSGRFCERFRYAAMVVRIYAGTVRPHGFYTAVSVSLLGYLIASGPLAPYRAAQRPQTPRICQRLMSISCFPAFSTTLRGIISPDVESRLYSICSRPSS